jgi:low affinity Fe/Cu permease
MGDGFHRIASKVACAVGSPQAFLLAAGIVAAWAIAGPLLDYSDEWQLFINTGTTVATFLMLFVLQNSQNRDTKAINIKLDELLRAIEGARTGLATVGDLSEAELDRIEGEFRRLAASDASAPTTPSTTPTDAPPSSSREPVDADDPALPACFSAASGRSTRH